MMTTLFNSLINNTHNIPTSGIYALVNETDKKVYIGYSGTKLVEHLTLMSLHISNNKYRNKDICLDKHKLDLRLLQDTSNEDSTKHTYHLLLKHKVTEFYKHYVDTLGYTVYSSYKPLQLTINLKVVPRVGVRLSLNTSHFRAFYVKTFKTVAEANEYISKTTVENMIREIP